MNCANGKNPFENGIHVDRLVSNVGSKISYSGCNIDNKMGVQKMTVHGSAGELRDNTGKGVNWDKLGKDFKGLEQNTKLLAKSAEQKLKDAANKLKALDKLKLELIMI